MCSPPHAKRRRAVITPELLFQYSRRPLRVCQGDGTVTVEMQFLADVELVCEECKGTRYKSGVLEILYKGKNIYQIFR
jgi:excinuclease ABC subunit A